MLFQTTAIRSDGTIDFNFRIPERIGVWHAFMQTVDPSKNFEVTIQDIDIVPVDNFEDF